MMVIFKNEGLLMETKMVISQHHRGISVPLWVLLSDFASQENCDDEEYDMMQLASDYIKELEDTVTRYEEYVDITNFTSK